MLRVLIEETLGSGKTSDVFKCVTLRRRLCQLEDRGQFVVIFENKAVFILYFINYVLFKVREVD